MKNRMDFTGTNVLVTGGARGIGYACAKAFVEHGANVSISDIDEEGVEKACNELAKQGKGKVVYWVADVREQDQCEGLIVGSNAKIGSLDVLVNNAGMAFAGDILNLDVKDFDKLMSVNLRGAFLMAQAAARSMIAENKQGNIINMSSVNSVLGLPNQIAYSMSKGGIAQMTRAMAVRLAEEGIRVNAIGPGSIATELLMDALSKDPLGKKAVLSRTPMGRLGEPAEVADIALYLASDYSSYITGETIYADGGRLALGYTVKVKD